MHCQSFYVKQKKNLQSEKRPRYECYEGLVSSGFLCKAAGRESFAILPSFTWVRLGELGASCTLKTLKEPQRVPARSGSCSLTAIAVQLSGDYLNNDTLSTLSYCQYFTEREHC